MVTTLTVIWFGLLGTLLGSFANAVALRYDPDKFILTPSNGRSHCPHCQKTLRAWELIPVLSWVWLRGRCAQCKESISLRYPAVEIGTGLAMTTIPYGLLAIGAPLLDEWRWGIAAACWVLIVLLLVIITLIDLKHYLIPDEATIGIAVAGIGAAWATAPLFSEATGSFLGSYAMLAGWHTNWIVGHGIGALTAGGILLALYLITRGRGIGFGDVKLAAALGLACAWPDSVVLIGIAFIIGSFAAIPAVLTKHAGMKTALPFGPFLAGAMLLLLGYGDNLAQAYFGLLLW